MRGLEYLSECNQSSMGLARPCTHMVFCPRERQWCTIGGQDGLTNFAADTRIPKPTDREPRSNTSTIFGLIACEEYYRPCTVHQLGTTESMRKEVCFLERYNSDKRYEVSRRKRLCGRQLSVFLVLVCGHFLNKWRKCTFDRSELTVFTQEQADYACGKVDCPFKGFYYRY